MRECKYGYEYGVVYYDYEEKTRKEYRCPHPVIDNSDYCIFHDPDYWRDHEDEVREEFYKLVKDAIVNDKPLYCIGFNLPSFDINDLKKRGLEKIEFSKAVYFSKASFQQQAYFSVASFQQAYFSKASFQQADFSRADFKGEVEFNSTRFPKFQTKDNKYEIPVTFEYATFRKRVRFIGEGSIKNNEDKRLDLSGVSFIGVDLSNVEFHNVRWLEKEEKLFKLFKIIKRNIIVDEYLINKNKNYEEVSKAYNELRKNYESRLLFNEASNFFVGEMEAIRRKLWNSNSKTDKIGSILYLFYKWIAMYGESVALPFIWTITIIPVSALIRYAFGICSIDDCYNNSWEYFWDSTAAYFQLPRSRPINDADLIERIISIPILGTLFMALKRKLERRK